MQVKRLIKKLTPPSLLKWKDHFQLKWISKTYSNMSTKQAFSKIYEDGAWGRSYDGTHKFHSGTGSHSDIVVRTYVEAVEKLLLSFHPKIDVVDLGCGDFSVGSKVRKQCNNYVACDIVMRLLNLTR
jgi:hypothetical protein